VTAGYSGTPLAKKLGIAPGAAVRVFGGPPELPALLDPLPDGASLGSRGGGRHRVVLAFHTSRAALEAEVPELLDALDVDGGLWIAWPKKASKVPTDITEDTVRDVFLPLGLVDNKVCAISDVWSGLRVVWRKERRRDVVSGAGDARS
jgi:hypothetical protein